MTIEEIDNAIEETTKALEDITEKGERAEAIAQAATLEEKKKILFSNLYLEKKGSSIEERKAMAYKDPRYEEFIDGLKEAIKNKINQEDKREFLEKKLSSLQTLKKTYIP